MVGTRSVDSKPVSTSEQAHTEPPFEHPNKMDVGAGDKQSSKARGQKHKTPSRDADKDESPTGPEE